MVLTCFRPNQFVAYLIHKSRKSEAPQVSRDGVDVFLPYDSNLYITDASPEHILLLNKYPQLPNSLVIPTKALVPQESNLTETDIRALWGVVSGIQGFGFFNCGKDAGYRCVCGSGAFLFVSDMLCRLSSQEHKHMQAVLLPQPALGEQCVRSI
jgi:ATP adenylyltransferase/5',5'''-P-1,P-4-tetraphosphate phosphorylase II